MFPTKAQLLGDARDAEGLAGKASAQNVMWRNVRDGHLVDVPVRLFPKVCFIRDLGVVVPIQGEHAFAACELEGEAESADTAKQVNEMGPPACYRTILGRDCVFAQGVPAFAGTSKIRFFFVFCFGHNEPTASYPPGIFGQSIM